MQLLTDPPFFCGVLDLGFAFAFAFAFACGDGPIDDTVVPCCVPKSSSPCEGTRTLVASCVNVRGRTRLFCVDPGGLSSGLYWVGWALTMSNDFALGFALGLAFGLALSS